jgi:hypothetical protein
VRQGADQPSAYNGRAVGRQLNRVSVGLTFCDQTAAGTEPGRLRAQTPRSDSRQCGPFVEVRNTLVCPRHWTPSCPRTA